MPALCYVMDRKFRKEEEHVMCRFAKSTAMFGFAAAVVGALTFGSAAPASAQGFYLNAPGIHIGAGYPHHHYDGRPYGSGYYDYYCGGGHFLLHRLCSPP